MSINQIKILAAVLTALFLPFSLISADRAYEVMKRHFDRKSADSTVLSVSLMLVDGGGNKLLRKFDQWSFTAGDESVSYIEVTEPADIAGVRFLTRSSAGSDEQRLYLPEIKKSKKIAGSGGGGKGGRFLGSDICYYDLESKDIDDARYTYVAEERITDRLFHVIDAIPLDEECPYAKSRFYVSDENSFIYKSILYNAKGEAVKQMDVLELKSESGIDFAARMVIRDLTRDHSTLYMMHSVKVNTVIPKSTFTVQHLER